MAKTGRRAGEPAGGLGRYEHRVLAACCVLIALLITLMIAGIVATAPEDDGRDETYPLPRSAPVADFVPRGDRSDSLFS